MKKHHGIVLGAVVGVLVLLVGGIALFGYFMTPAKYLTMQHIASMYDRGEVYTRADILDELDDPDKEFSENGVETWEYRSASSRFFSDYPAVMKVEFDGDGRVTDIVFQRYGEEYV